MFGYDHAPHGHAEIAYDNVRVPAENMYGGKEKALRLPKGGLGRGEFTIVCDQSEQQKERWRNYVTVFKARVAFGKRLAEQGCDSGVDC